MNENIKLGIGSIRFPQVSSSIIDLPMVLQIIHEGEKQGINFIDTSYAYFGGQSEVAIGLAIEEKRENWKISTRFNPLGKKKDDLHKCLVEQLDRLKTDYIDYYGFHGISKATFDNVIIPTGFLDELVAVKDEGVIKKMGFSFHDIPENLIYIIDKAKVFDYVICQYNFMKPDNKEVMHYAKERGLEIIIMGPFCGGKVKVNTTVLDICKCNSGIEMALRYILSNRDVDIILSGVSNPNEIIENARIVKNSQYINTDLVDILVKEGKIDQKYYCTGCGYCLPCPKNINIPEIFSIANGIMKKEYITINKCISCGICEEKCPQKLNIRNIINEVIISKSERRLV